MRIYSHRWYWESIWFFKAFFYSSLPQKIQIWSWFYKMGHNTAQKPRWKAKNLVFSQDWKPRILYYQCRTYNVILQSWKKCKPRWSSSRVSFYFVLKFYFCFLKLIIKYEAWTFSNIFTYTRLIQMMLLPFWKIKILLGK